MARIRTIKPEFFLDEHLFEAERESSLPIRVAYAGLWGHCDREGRFEWRPRRLKTGILPYDDVDFARILDVLEAGGFVRSYDDEAGRKLGLVPSFTRHQVINNREAASSLPAPPENLAPLTREARAEHASTTREARESHARSVEGKGRERKESGNGTAADAATPDDLLGLWRRICVERGFADIRVFDSDLRRKCGLRLSEESDLEVWRETFEAVASSPFCRGESSRNGGKKPWRADFRWFFENAANRLKVLEGRYGNGASPADGSVFVA